MNKRIYVVNITDYKEQNLTKWNQDFWYINFTLSVCKKGTRLYQETFIEKDVTLYVPIGKSIREAILSYAQQRTAEHFNLQDEPITLEY
jgi:hypothetical protein